MPDNTPPKYGTPKWFTTIDSPLKQMSSPNAYKGDSLGGGLDYTFGTALPLAVGGYPFAYNFTGLGSNSGDFLQKLGIASETSSDRTLGSNYFIPLKDRQGDNLKCNVRSKGGCSGKDAHMYIEGHPSTTMGTLPAMLDGLANMNPSIVFEALADSLLDLEPTCEEVTLPVGSSLNMCREAEYGDFKGQDLGFQPNVGSPEQAQTVNSRCLEGCTKASFTDIDNCRRDCNRLWWEETSCVPAGKHSKLVQANQCGRRDSNVGRTMYTLPTGTKPRKTKSISYSPAKQRSSMKGIRPDGNSESFVSLPRHQQHNQRPPQCHPSIGITPKPVGHFAVCSVVAVVVLLAVIHIVSCWIHPLG